MKRILWVLTVPLLFGLTACAPAPSYEDTVLAWQQKRLASLKQPGSYLTIIDLHWLKPGSTSIGSSMNADIRLPAGFPERLGNFEFDGDGVMFQPAPAEVVLVDGLAINANVFMADDTTENPVTASHKNLSWMAIERHGRHGIRIRDTEHPIMDSFGPLPYFPIDETYRVEGRMLRYPEPKIVQVGTVIEGLGWEPESPGIVEFMLDGEMHRLEAYASSNKSLFFVFGDQTSGRQTYPAGRFLYADDPGDGGQVILDFNKSYSPPCAFNDFSTCPVATPANRLRASILAGELYDKSLAPIAEY